MIIGTSHISITSLNLQEDIQQYEEEGFTLQFISQDIDNSTEKKAFLTRYTARHSLAVLKGSTGVNLELITYPQEIPQSKNNVYEITKKNGSIQQITINALNIKESLSFWEGILGYEIIGKSDNYYRLYKHSIFPQWASTVLLQSQPSLDIVSKLDNQGVTCMAFLVSGIKEELKRCTQHDLYCSNLFKLKIQDKILKIAMVYGPSHEIIEFIEIA